MSNVEIVNAFYSNLAQGKVPEALALLAAKVEWIESDAFSYGGIYTGPEAVLNNVFMKFSSEWENFSVTAKETIDGGKVVVVTGWYAGTYKATGKSVRAEFAHFWQVSKGRIGRFRMFTDTLAIGRVLARV
jgi:ketosteroid isomerase-like protein